MKSIKKFLRNIDLSGLPFSFKYKSKEKYTTSLGGFMITIFFIVALYYVIYYFIEFINKKNFTIIYYTTNIAQTEIIKLKETKGTVSFGFDCQFKGKHRAEDLFIIETKYINYTKNSEGIYYKDTIILSSHFCTYNDFFNEHNDSFNRLNINKFRCLDDYNYELMGIFSDISFTYYEFTVKSKEDTDENLNNIEEFLMQNDCKLQIAYIEKADNLDNYSQPITSYLNEVFIQLNPTFFIKRNMFFMIQHLVNKDDLFGDFSDSKNESITSIFSRYEEYFLFLGLNRSITKPPDYLNYAKIYLRADTKKREIKRNYQNLFEFYANISSLLIGVFRVLVIILNFFNNFFAESSFSNKIFIFKEFKNKNFNMNKRNNEINKIKSLLNNCNLNETENSSFDTEISDFYSNEKIFGNYELLTYNKNKINNDYINNNSKSARGKTISYTEKGIENLIKDINNSKNKNINNMGNISSEKIKFKNSNSFKNNNNSLTTDKIIVNKNEINGISNNNVLNKLKEKDEKNIKENKNNNKHYLNVCEIIIIYFCRCCYLTPKLKLKSYYYNKIMNILNKTLDIVSYIRNTLLFDTMNEILLNSNNKDIINFLYRPILNTNKLEKIDEKEFNELNEDYKEIYFDKFYNKLSELLKKPNFTNKEKKIIFLVKQKINEFC